MLGTKQMRTLAKREASWGKRHATAKELDEPFTTISGVPVKRLYTPADLAETDELDDIGLPGEFPYTRGVHATGYRGRKWTMRMFAGFGTAEETNERFKYLLGNGQTGLSVAFDMPTLMGYDTDHALSRGEFGRCGVAVSSLADMEMLFDGIPLGEISTSMTINGPAAIIWAMYIAAAEKQGVPIERLRGHPSERHPEGVHSPERVHLPPRALDAVGGGHHRVRHEAHARVEHDQRQRLPHP